MMGSGWSMDGLFGIGHLLWGVLLVAGIIMVGRWLSDIGSAAGDPAETNAMRILMDAVRVRRRLWGCWP